MMLASPRLRPTAAATAARLLSSKSPKTCLAKTYRFSRSRTAGRSASTAAATTASVQLHHHDPTKLLPRQYLRDVDLSNYDASTHQRNDASYDGYSGRPMVFGASAYQARRDGGHKYQVKSWRHLEEGDDGISGDRLEITWGDGVLTTYPNAWVQEQVELYAKGDGIPSTPDTAYKPVQRVLWSDVVENDVRKADSPMALSFNELVGSNSSGDIGMNKAIEALYKYGFLLVTDTPVHDGGTGVATLAAAVSGGDVKTSSNVSLLARYRENGKDNDGNAVTVLPDGTDGPLRTLYGNVWSTHSSGMAEGASQADSAYGSDGLPLHTDMTYMRDPPGLQIFAMAQPAPEGGESIFADGFAVAERLRSDHPEAFDTLCSTTRRYRSICTETGWHLEGKGPAISAIDRGYGLPPASRWGAVTAIRHNDLDRLPDLPPLASDGLPMGEAETDEFYATLRHAHRQWDTLLGSDEFRLVLHLQPGDTVVVANQRCFHGRYGFRASKDTARIVMGCYVGQDDLDSRFRRAGFQCPT